MKNRLGVLLVGVLLGMGLMALVSCSVDDKVRTKQIYHLGPIPEDVLLDDNGYPYSFNVSSKTNGDVDLVYISTKGKIVDQMYGCNLVSLACESIFKQGAYVWDIPGKEPQGIKYAPKGYQPYSDKTSLGNFPASEKENLQAAADIVGLKVWFDKAYELDGILGAYVEADTDISLHYNPEEITDPTTIQQFRAEYAGMN